MLEFVLFFPLGLEYTHPKIFPKHDIESRNKHGRLKIIQEFVWTICTEPEI